MALSYTVFDIFDIDKYYKLAIRVRGNSRSSKRVGLPFDSLPMVHISVLL